MPLTATAAVVGVAEVGTVAGTVVGARVVLVVVLVDVDVEVVEVVEVVLDEVVEVLVVLVDVVDVDVVLVEEDGTATSTDSPVPAVPSAAAAIGHSTETPPATINTTPATRSRRPNSFAMIRPSPSC